MKSTSDREIAIYWDYENVILPQWCGPAEAAKRIYNSVSKYGRVVERRLYFDYQKHTGTGPLDCSGLDLSGFDLVNTPTRNAKETLDKKLIADVLTFAWDCTARNTENKPCVVLITSDGDYAYTLAKLRDRGVMNIVMFGKDCSVAQILVENADVALSFEKEVLDTSDHSKVASSLDPSIEGTDLACLNLFFKNLPAMENVKEFVKFIERNQRAVVQRAVMFGSDSSYLFAHIWFMDVNDGARVLNAARDRGLTFKGRNIHVSFDTNIPSTSSFAMTSSDRRYERKPQQLLTRSETMQTSWELGLPQQPSTKLWNKQTSRKPPQYAQVAATATLMDVTKCCVCLYNEQVSRTQICVADTQEYEKRWVPINTFYGPFKLSFLLKADEEKNRIKSIMDKSIFERYVTVARKQVESETYVGVPWHKNRGVREDLSTEAYLRLTKQGRMLVQTTFHEKKVDDFLGSRFKGPTEMCSLSDGKKLSSASPSPEPHHGGGFLYFTNLPNTTTVGEFVEFLENEYAIVVERAVVYQNSKEVGCELEVTDTIDVNWCSADVLLANAQCGLMIAFLALTNGILFNGTQIKFKVYAQEHLDLMLERMADSGESNCYSAKKENPLQKSVAVPILDDIRLRASNAERAFCRCLFNEQKLIGNIKVFPCDQCWVPYSIIGTKFRSSALFSDLTKEDCRKFLKIIREMSINDSLVEIGRKKLAGSRGYVNVPWSDDGGDKEALSKEFYLRLTDAGISLLQSTKLTEKKDEAFVFLQNLPWPMQVLDLVQFLEVDNKVAVRQASINYQHPSDCCDAHIECINREDGSRICHDGVMIYSGREIHTHVDTRVPAEELLPISNPALFYMKSEVIATATAAGRRDSISVTEESSSAGFDEVATDEVRVTEEREDSQLVTEENSSAGSEEMASIIHAAKAGDSVPHTVGINDQFSDCDATGTNAEDAILKQKTIFEDGSFKLAQNAVNTAQGSEEIDKAEDLVVYCEVRVDTTASRKLIFQKELDEAVQAKNFAKAATIQADIEQLESDNLSSGDLELVALIKSELDQELHQIVKQKDFAKAAIIQSRIEGLEKGTLSVDKAKSLMMEDLDTELGEAIKAKDFVQAGTIQARIERLEHGRRVS